MTSAPAIAFEAVSLTLKPHFWSAPRTLLDDVSFRVERGQSCALLGANGAGKTTLLRLLLGLFRPTSGRGWLDGLPMATPASRRSLGFLPERPALPLDCTPLEFVSFAARQSGLSRRDARRSAQRSLVRLGLGEHVGRRMRPFSKGMLQRVGLAQAVVHEPHVLVLDEPLSGLDPPARRDVRVLLQQERARGAALLFSTHILSDVVSSCDRAAVLIDGRLAHFAAPYALLQQAHDAHETPAQIDVIVRQLEATTAQSLATRHQAVVLSEYEHEIRFGVPGLAAANALLHEAQGHGAVVLGFEQDTRLLERLLHRPRATREGT